MKRILSNPVTYAEIRCRFTNPIIFTEISRKILLHKSHRIIPLRVHDYLLTKIMPITIIAFKYTMHIIFLCRWHTCNIGYVDVSTTWLVYRNGAFSRHINNSCRIIAFAYNLFIIRSWSVIRLRSSFCYSQQNTSHQQHPDFYF